MKLLDQELASLLWIKL